MTSYQQLQMSLCCTDIMMGVCGPLVSAVVTTLFLTQHLAPGHFMKQDLFHKFQYSDEALEVGFDHVIKTDYVVLVVVAMGISLSSTVSIMTIAKMALLR